jgi:hypothetical protein
MPGNSFMKTIWPLCFLKHSSVHPVTIITLIFFTATATFLTGGDALVVFSSA